MRSLALVLPLLTVMAHAQDAQINREALAKEMNALTGKDWRPGVAFGEKLAALPSPVGFEILRDNWQKGANIEPRKQMFKGFVFSSHPDTVKVLNLGATDPDVGMQTWSFQYLKEIAFQDFNTDYKSYKPWFEKYGNKPLPQVVGDNLRTLCIEAKALTSKDRSRRLGFLHGTWTNLDIPAVPEALDLVKQIVANPNPSQEETGAIPTLLKAGHADESFLTLVIKPALNSKVNGVRTAAITALGDAKPSWAGAELIRLMFTDVARPGGIESSSFTIGQALGSLGDRRVIPSVIAAIDAHNSYYSVYGLGYFALTPLTAVPYDDEHDGTWWRQWWNDNRERFGDVGKQDIPKIERSPDYQPTPPEPLKGLTESLARGDMMSAYSFAERLHGRDGTLATPTLIGVLVADDSPETRKAISAILSEDGEVHNAAWWTAWWKTNDRFAADLRAKPIPVFKVGAKPKTVVPDAPDVADLPAEEILGNGTRDMRAFLVKPRIAAPANGFKLFLVLPGGDGSADFFPFLKRVAKGAVPTDTLLVQLVAKQWSKDEDRVVWPTRRLNPQKATFVTEEFITKTIDAVAAKYKIDRTQVFACGWSSGGPPVWATLLSEKSPLAGAFVAMSVFQPTILPPVANAKGKRVFLIHSPQDFIPIAMAETARDSLRDAGAKVRYQTYEGGHGWHGDIFGYFRDAIDFLEGAN